MPKDSPLVGRWPSQGSNFSVSPLRAQTQRVPLFTAQELPRPQLSLRNAEAGSSHAPAVLLLGPRSLRRRACPQGASASLRLPRPACPSAGPSARPTRGERGARAGGGTTCARRTAPRGAPEGAGPEPRASCARRRPPPGPGRDLARAH